MKNIRVFYPKIFILLVVKCSVYLNRLVFVMLKVSTVNLNRSNPLEILNPGE